MDIEDVLNIATINGHQPKYRSGIMTDAIECRNCKYTLWTSDKLYRETYILPCGKKDEMQEWIKNLKKQLEEDIRNNVFRVLPK